MSTDVVMGGGTTAVFGEGTDVTAGATASVVVTAGVTGSQGPSGDIDATKSFGWIVFESGDACVLGDGLAGFAAPAWMTTYRVTDVQVSVFTPGVTGTMDIQVRRVRSGAAVDVLSTPVTLGSGEFTIGDGVVDAGNADIEAGDLFYIDRDAIHATPAEGLSVMVTITKI